MAERPIYKSTTPWFGGLVILLSTGFYYALGGEEAHEIINAIMCAVSFGVAIGFSATVCKSASKHPWEYQADDAMILGVFILGLALCVVFIGLWGYRLNEGGDPKTALWWKTN